MNIPLIPEDKLDVRIVDYLPEDTALLTLPLTAQEYYACRTEQDFIDASARKTVVIKFKPGTTQIEEIKRVGR